MRRLARRRCDPGARRAQPRRASRRDRPARRGRPQVAELTVRLRSALRRAGRRPPCSSRRPGATSAWPSPRVAGRTTLRRRPPCRCGRTSSRLSRRASRSTARRTTRAPSRSAPRSRSSTRSGSSRSKRACSASPRSLHEELDRLGVRVVSRPEESARSGITTFEVSDVLTENEAFLERLLDERILVSLRYTSGVGGIRVSTHYFNDESDLDTLLGAVRRLARRRLAGAARR